MVRPSSVLASCRSTGTRDDELEYLSSATLTKRKDFLEAEEEARTANRVLYFRRNADCEHLIQACTAKLATDPGNVRALLIRAASYTKEGTHARAVGDYTSILALSDAAIDDSSRLDAHYMRGTAHEKLNDLGAAIADFTATLELEPTHVKAILARGGCYNLGSDYEAACEDYATALRIDEQRKASVPRSSHSQKHRDVHTESPNEVLGLIKAVHTTDKDSQGRQSADQSTDQSQGTRTAQHSRVRVSVPGSNQPSQKRTSRGPKYDVEGISTGSAGSSGGPSSVASRSSSGSQAVNVSHFIVPLGPKSTATGVSGRRARECRVEGLPEQARASHSAVCSSREAASDSCRTDFEATAQLYAPVSTANSPQKPKSHSRSTSYAPQRPMYSPPLVATSKSLDSAIGSVRQTSAREQGQQDREVGQHDRQDQQRRAEEHYAAGYTFRKRFEFISAVKEYSLALALVPGHFKALFNRGYSYDKIGDYTAALTDYTAAIAVDPQSSYAFYNRGITRDRIDDLEGAIADFSAASRLNPNNADFYHNRGYSLRKMGRLTEAVEDYSRAIALNPGHCRAHYNRAWVHDQLGHMDAALAGYSASIKLEPGNPTAYSNRGRLLERIHGDEEALEDFNAALDLDSSLAATYADRGALLLRLRNIDAAADDFDRATEIEPHNLDFLRKAGLCHRSRADFHSSILCFDRVLRLDPSDVASLSSRGYAHRKLGHHAEAVADYSSALMLSPDSVRLYSNRGYCLAKLGNYSDAIADYDEALCLEPENANAFHNRGISYDKLGNRQAAIADFTSAVLLDPSNLGAYFNRGTAYDALGRHDEATSDFARVLDVDIAADRPANCIPLKISDSAAVANNRASLSIVTCV